MKKPILLIGFILLLGLHAASADSINEAAGKVTLGTFSGSQSVVDNSLTSYAQSGSIDQEPQFLTIDLGQEIYLGSIKIYWGADAVSRNYSIRVSKDNRSWLTQFQRLDAATGILDSQTGTISQVVSTRRYAAPTRYLQIYVPVSSEASAPNVKISEIQIFQAQNLKYNIENIDIFPLSGRRAIVSYKTTMASARGIILYGKNQKKLDQFGQNIESGALNSILLSKLDPAALYYCTIKAWNESGNMALSELSYLNPLIVNLASGKDVSGTFTVLPPNDPLVNRVKPVLPRIVDSDIEVFGGMATSGSIKNKDQEVIIDLSESHLLRSIVLFWRAIAYPENFSVSVSNNKTIWREVASGINAGEGAFIRSGDGEPIRVVNIPVEDQLARYIKVFIPKNSSFYVKDEDWDYVQLMEIEVLSK